jgi:hypothetical protein
LVPTVTENENAVSVRVATDHTSDAEWLDRLDVAASILASSVASSDRTADAISAPASAASVAAVMTLLPIVPTVTENENAVSVRVPTSQTSLAVWLDRLLTDASIRPSSVASSVRTADAISELASAARLAAVMPLLPTDPTAPVTLPTLPDTLPVMFPVMATVHAVTDARPLLASE